MDNSNRERNVTTDRDTIENWADERDAVPAHNPDGEGRQYDLFVHDGVPQGYEERTWDDFFDKFESEDRAFVYRGESAGEGLGEYEIADRNEAVARATVDDEEIDERLLEGETVTTEVTETTVVEREIEETETIETEAVETDVVGGRITEAELVDWKVVDTDVTVDLRDDGNVERAYDATDEGAVDSGVLDLELDATVDGTVTAEIEETWRIRREEDERVVVESRLEDVDVEERDEVAAGEGETSVNVEGVQRSIVESDALHADLNEEQVVGGNVMETTQTETDVLESQLIQRRTYEDTLRRRRRLHFDVTDDELLDTELVDTEAHDADVVEVEYDDETETVVTKDGSVEAAETEGATMDADIADEMLTEDDVDKPVANEDGDRIGTVAALEGDGMIVKPEAGSMERLGSEAAKERDEDYHVGSEQILEIDDKAVVIDAPPAEEFEEEY